MNTPHKYTGIIILYGPYGPGLGLSMCLGSRVLQGSEPFYKFNIFRIQYEQPKQPCSLPASCCDMRPPAVTHHVRYQMYGIRVRRKAVSLIALGGVGVLWPGHGVYSCGHHMGCTPVARPWGVGP